MLLKVFTASRADLFIESLTCNKKERNEKCFYLMLQFHVFMFVFFLFGYLFKNQDHHGKEKKGNIGKKYTGSNTNKKYIMTQWKTQEL